jgi:hypothetical protein
VSDDILLSATNDRHEALAEHPTLVFAIIRLRRMLITASGEPDAYEHRVRSLAAAVAVCGVSTRQFLPDSSPIDSELARALLDPTLNDRAVALRVDLNPGQVKDLREKLLAEAPTVIAGHMQNGTARQAKLEQSLDSIATARVELARRGDAATMYLSPQQLAVYELVANPTLTQRQIMARLNTYGTEVPRLVWEVAIALHTGAYTDRRPLAH